MTSREFEPGSVYFDKINFQKYIQFMYIKLLSGALGAEISGIDLKDSSKENYERINNLLLEAGSGLNGAMTEAGLIDEFIIYTAPLILGSDANPMIEIPLKKMSDKIKLNIIEVSQIDCDIKIRATIKWITWQIKEFY